MLTIYGKDVKIWKNEHEGRSGKWYTYSVSVSKKVDGKYVNKPLKVRLTRELENSVSFPNGAVIDFEGFPTLDIYTDKDGNERREVMLMIQKLRVNGSDYEDIPDNFAEADEDIPF